MNMPMSVAKWLVFNLHVMKSDDVSTGYFSSGYIDGYPLDSRKRQQLAVDMILRCSVSDLIVIVPHNWPQQAGLSSIEAFMQELARVDQNKKTSPDSPESRQHDLDMGIWLEAQLCCTTIGEALVNCCFPGALDLEDDFRVAQFNDEVCKIFMAHGVPWSMEPLIPLSF